MLTSPDFRELLSILAEHKVRYLHLSPMKSLKIL